MIMNKKGLFCLVILTTLIHSNISFDEDKQGFILTSNSHCEYAKVFAKFFNLTGDKVIFLSCKVKAEVSTFFLAKIQIEGTNAICKTGARVIPGYNTVIIPHFAKDEDCQKVIIEAYMKFKEGQEQKQDL